MRLDHAMLAPSRQQGAALIAVLIILVVITLLGVTAMRMSLTGLTLATNSQINALLFEAADKGMVDFNAAVGANTTAALSPGGVAAASANVYCLNAAIANGLSNGPCSTTANGNFLSGRQNTMVQVNYERKLLGLSSNQTSVILVSQGSGKSALPPERIAVVSTAVMTTVGAASTTQINNCLLLPGNDAQDPDVQTATDCLTDSGAVFTSHINEFIKQ